MCNFVLRVVDNKFEYCKMHTPPGTATAGSRLVFLLDHPAINKYFCTSHNTKYIKAQYLVTILLILQVPGTRTYGCHDFGY